MGNYSDYLNSLSKKGIKMLTYDAPTDEELYAEASLAAEQDYKAEFDRLFSQTKSKKDLMTQSILDTESDYKTAAEAMEEEYEDAAKSLSEEALSRGLGRSSYALDLQSENLSDKQDSLTALMSDKIQAVNVIQNQIEALEQDFIDNQSYLSSKKEAEIKTTLAKLKAERDDTIREVLEYNNDLIMDQKEYELKKLKAQKSSSRTNSTSSNKSDSTSSSALINEYNGLTGAGKLAFFNSNQDVLQSKLDSDTYKSMLREIYDIVEQGVSPASGTSDNYYK